MTKKYMTMKCLGFSIGLLITSSSFARIADSDQTIADFKSAEQACKDFVGGELPDATSLKEIIKNLGTRLQPAYYWSTTASNDCGAQECRIQIESPTLTERSENALNETGASICITQSPE